MLRIKRLCLAASLFLTLFALPVFAATTKTVCSSGAVTIPNASAVGGTSTVSVAETGTISNIRLTGVKITHGFIGEISAYLTHDGTKTVTIGDDPGVVAVTSPQGCKGKNITNLTISDAGTKSIETNCTMTDPAYNPAYTYTPSFPLSLLTSPASFYGDDISGTWALKIVDGYNYDSVAGSLDSWCLEYTRPTNSIITLNPAEGALTMGAATYPTGVTQDIIIEASSGDNFEISRVEFVSVSAGATNDFIGSVVKELPLPMTVKANNTIKSGSPYTTVLTLAPNDKYRFSAQCKPTGTGNRTATFQITTNLPAPYDILAFPLSCDGNVGVYSSTLAANTNVNLGSTALNNTLTSSFTVSNTGNYALTLNKSLGATDTDVDIQSPTFPLTLAASASQIITMKCTPTVAGALSRKLTLSSTDTPSLSSVDYTFKCAGDAPVAKFTPSSGTVNVGTVLEGANITTKVIDVKNNNGAGSTAVLDLSGATITGTPAGVFSVVNLPTNIPGNTTDSTGITVKCDATGLTGAPITGTNYTATLTFNTNDTTKLSVTFALSCLVKTPEPIATFSPAPTTLNFNTVGSAGGTQSISIGNSSSATKPLTVTSAGFSPAADAVAFELLDSSSVAIAVGASLSIGINLTSSINVKCKGNAAPGTYSATLTLNTDDPTKPPITYPVSCTVTANNNYPLYSSNPAPGSTISVGSAQIGTWSSSQTIIQVSEIGNATLKVDIDSLSSTDFTIDSPALPFTIADGGSPVDIKVKCKPNVAGAGNTATLKLKASDTTDNPVSNYPAPTYNLSCTGLIPTYSSTPTAPSGTINVGTVAVGSAVTATLNVSNSGNASTSLTVNTPVITGSHPNDFSVTAGLPLSVAQGAAAKSMTINCSPTAVGARTATLQLTTNDPSKLAVTYTLNCTGVEAIGTVYSSDPAVIKDPVTSKWSGVIDFGNVPLNTTAPKTLTISESGSTILNVGKPATATDFLTGDTTTFSVTNEATLFTTSGSNAINPGFFIQNGGVDKVINLTCQPTTIGAHTATLQLRNDDNDSTKTTVTYTLKCNGVKSAYSSSPAPLSTLNCGSTPLLVGSNMTETITVTELGTKDLILSSPSFSGANSGDFSIVSPTFSPTVPVTIADGGATATTRDIEVKFTPSAAGTRVATLTFATDDPDNATVSYNFSCQAIAPGYSSTPAASSTINCGGDTPVGFEHVETLTIAETGDVDLKIDSATFSPGDFTVDSATTFPLTIANGTVPQEIKVKFTPTVVGNRTATLNVVTNDPAQKTVTYSFNCPAVTPPGYSSTPAPSSTLSCGGTTTLTGAHYMETLNISETGNSSDLIVDSAALSGTNAGDFAIFSPSIPMTVAKATAQDIEVRFSPTVAGTRTATLTVKSNDLSNKVTTYKLSCQAAAPPVVIVTKRLTVAVNPSNAGTVNDDLEQIRCGKGTTACSDIFDINTAISLTPTPATGYQFKNWTGDCTTNSVILNTDKTCTANFELIPVIEKPPVTPPVVQPPVVQPPVVQPPVVQPPVVQPPVQPPTPPVIPPVTNNGETVTLSVTTSGKGSGKVTGAGINCGDGGNAQCSQSVAIRNQVMLAAQPNSGSTFLGWSGHCEGKTAIAIVNMTENKQCVARFELLASEPEKEDDGLGNYCTGKGYTNISCNARGAVIGDIDGKIEVDSAGYLSNGIVTKPLINKGWVANLTIEETGSLTGGIVTGSIINKGEMSNFEFRGDILSGGKLSGVIKNNSPNVCFADGIVRGVIKDVNLAANTKILGGRLSGKIVGDSQSPAHLSKVILTSDTSLTNVLLEEDVIIEQDVSHETTKMTKVKLAPNLKIRGGKISGELTGEETAPAHLSNVVIKSGTELENVVLDEQVAIEDEKTCTAQQLNDAVDQNPTDAAETENSAIALNPNGKQLNSTSQFNVQLTTPQGKRTNKTILSQAEAKTVTLSAHVAVQAEHTGKSAEMLIVVQHKNAQQTNNYMKTATGWKVWDGQLSHLQPLETYQQLPANIDLSAFSGDLSKESGEFNLYAGYRLQDGTLVFNGQNPLRFAVTRTKEYCALTCGCQ